MAFCVVHFTPSNEVAVVPGQWVTNEFCVWPPKQMQSRILPLIPKGISSSASWDLFHVKVLGTYETYHAARQKLNKAENESDLNTTDPENYGRGKREKREKRTSSLSTDSDGETQNLSPPPSFQSFLNSSIVGSEEIPFIHKVCISNQTDQREISTSTPFSSRKRKCHSLSDSRHSVISCPIRSKIVMEQPEIPKIMESFSPSLLSADENEVDKIKSSDCVENAFPSQVSTNRSNFSGFERSVLRELNILKVNQRTILESLDAIFQLLKQRTENTSKLNGLYVESATLKEILQLLPLSNMENLILVEENLGKENVAHEMVEFLSQIGGGTLDFGVKLILRRLLTNDFATRFSYFGIRGKASFKTLKLCQVIHDTARGNSLWKDVKEIEVDKIIMNWLRHAKERSSSKQKSREMKT